MNKKSNSVGYREKIISYFERELKYYEMLEVLAKQQGEVIQSGDIKKLEFLIKEKENVIKEIKQLINSNGESIEVLLYHDHTVLSDKTIKRLSKKKHSLLTALMNYEQDSIDLLTASIDDIKSKTGFLGKRRKILNALKFQQSGTPRYLDVVK